MDLENEMVEDLVNKGRTLAEEYAEPEVSPKNILEIQLLIT
jgi:hypothetical protein